MMTFDDVFEQLSAIDTAAAPLLRAADFHPDKGLGVSVCPLEDHAEDLFVRRHTESLLESLCFLHQELCYLKSPVRGEYRLELFPNGRYGFFDEYGHTHTLSCGMSIEAKLYNRQGNLCWVKSRIEHDGDGYFLWEYPGIPLAGLTVREREVAGCDF